MVIIGFAITLPMMITGSRLGLQLGLQNALYAFVMGSLILTTVGSATAVVATKTRFSTYKILEYSFGLTGAKLVTALLTTTLFGWYGVTAALFGDALYNAALDTYGLTISPKLFVILGSLLMISITVFGFKALDRLSLIAVPLLALFLCFLVVYTLSHTGQSFTEILAQPHNSMELGVSTSVVVGTYIVGAVLVPDLCRYARSTLDGVFAIVASLGISLPLILAASAIPSLATGEADLVRIMVQLGVGSPALMVIVFATWTSNANNLYSTSLSLAALVEKISKWKLTILAGIAGTLVAVGGITEYFIPFLLLLGVAIPPIAGVYLSDYFFVGQSENYRQDSNKQLSPFNFTALAAWFMGTSFGIASANDFINWSLTNIPAVDSFIVAAAVYVAISKTCNHLSSTELTT